MLIPSKYVRLALCVALGLWSRRPLNGRSTGAHPAPVAAAAFLLLLTPACLDRPTPNPGIIIVGVANGPNNLDPRNGTHDAERRRLYGDAQAIIAEEAPDISLWYKTDVAVGRRWLAGIQLLPVADFTSLKDVTRTASGPHATN